MQRLDFKPAAASRQRFARPDEIKLFLGLIRRKEIFQIYGRTILERPEHRICRWVLRQNTPPEIRQYDCIQRRFHDGFQLFGRLFNLGRVAPSDGIHLHQFRGSDDQNGQQDHHKDGQNNQRFHNFLSTVARVFRKGRQTRQGHFACDRGDFDSSFLQIGQRGNQLRVIAVNDWNGFL